MPTEHRYLTMARTEPIETLRANFLGSAIHMLKHAADYTPEYMRSEALAYEQAEAIARRRQDERFDPAMIFSKVGDEPCVPPPAPAPEECRQTEIRSAQSTDTKSGTSNGAAPNAAESAPTLQVVLDRLNALSRCEWRQEGSGRCMLGRNHQGSCEFPTPPHDPHAPAAAIIDATTGGAK